MTVNEAWLYIDGHLNLRQVKRWPHSITDDDVVIRDGVGMHGSFSNKMTSRWPRGSPTPSMKMTVIGEYMSAKMVLRNTVSCSSYTLSAKPSCLGLVL